MAAAKTNTVIALWQPTFTSVQPPELRHVSSTRNLNSGSTLRLTRHLVKAHTLLAHLLTDQSRDSWTERQMKTMVEVKEDKKNDKGERVLT